MPENLVMVGCIGIVVSLLVAILICQGRTSRRLNNQRYLYIQFAKSSAVDATVSNLLAQYTGSCRLMYWNDCDNVSERRFLVELLSDRFSQELTKGLIQCGCREIRFSNLPDSD